MSSAEPSEKWYYDACTLDSRLETFYEIINRRHVSITSHLAVGEGYSNCLLKGDRTRGYEVLESFINLMNKLRDQDLLEIVGNDGIESVLEKIREVIPTLSYTDSSHIATALREQCCIFRTIDNDFNGFTKPMCEKLAHENGMSKFAVSPMSSKSRDQLFRDKKVMNRKKK